VRCADGSAMDADPSLTSPQPELLPSEDIDDRRSCGDGVRPEIVLERAEHWWAVTSSPLSGRRSLRGREPPRP